MTTKQKIEYIDDFLSPQENFTHGEEGEQCTISRKYLKHLEQDADSQLTRLYDWLIDPNRKPANTNFTSGMLRNVAREVEFMIYCVKKEDKIHSELLLDLVEEIKKASYATPMEESKEVELKDKINKL